LASELYDGETYDASLGEPNNWRPTKVLALPPNTALIAPEAPPIRRIEEKKPVEVITTPTGKKILDFGQNLVGWVKILEIPAKEGLFDQITLRFAEVLENGELGVRPLRSAKATDCIFPPKQGNVQDWEPKFTTHGFQYCEVSGPKAIFKDLLNNFVAVVVHSDMQRIGHFDSSHKMINQLHENVIWGLRGNFVGLPTDCPQRDER
jgi:alpha-L-rhamnosidase